MAKVHQITTGTDSVDDLSAPRIDGVVTRRLQIFEDARGEVVDLFRLDWNFHPEPLVFAYFVTIRPKMIKGWVVHETQDDRIATLHGTLHWVLFDNREKSPTYRQLNHFTFSEKNRVLMTIPKGVFHAVQNVGGNDAWFVNMPTRPYQHSAPDKYRLPVKNDLIPYDFAGEQ